MKLSTGGLWSKVSYCVIFLVTTGCFSSPSVTTFAVVPEEGDTFFMKRNTNEATRSQMDGNKVAQVGNYIYSYGGWTQNPRTSYSDIYRSSGDLSYWEEMPDAPWHPRHCFGLAKIDTTTYVLGGDNLHPNFDVWKTNDGINFTLVTDSLQNIIGKRIMYGICSHKGNLFILGGQSDIALNSGVSDVWTSRDGASWTRITSGLSFLAKNISGSVASFNGKIWVLGGGYYDHPDNQQRWTNDVYSSEDGITWTKETNAPWTPRQFADVSVWDDKLWLVGGHGGENLNDIWYMKKSGEWVQFQTPETFEPRHASGVGTYKNRLIILCGYYHNDCWEINKNR